MSLSRGLYALLSTAGALNGAKVYPVTLPENPALPAIVYTQVGGTTQPTLSTGGMAQQRVQVDTYGAGYDGADQLREAVIALLHGFQGQLAGGPFIDSCFYIGPVTNFENIPRQYRLAAEFRFTFSL